MIQINASQRLKAADDWSKKVTDNVKAKDSPPGGTFKGSASSIARALKKIHPDLKAAMSALNFYINRGGDDVPNKSNLEKAKDELRKLYA